MSGTATRSAALLLAAALAVIGCGGSTSSAAAPATAAPTSAPEASSGAAETDAPTQAAGIATDPCSLVSLAEAKAAASTVVRAVQARSGQDWASGECTWVDDSGATVFSISVGDATSIGASSSGPTAADVFAATKKSFDDAGDGSSEYQLLSGIGDQAIYWKAGMLVTKGGTAVDLYFVSTDAIPQPAAESLAKAAIGRV